MNENSDGYNRFIKVILNRISTYAVLSSPLLASPSDDPYIIELAEMDLK